MDDLLESMNSAMAHSILPPEPPQQSRAPTAGDVHTDCGRENGWVAVSVGLNPAVVEVELQLMLEMDVNWATRVVVSNMNNDERVLKVFVECGGTDAPQLDGPIRAGFLVVESREVADLKIPMERLPLALEAAAWFHYLLRWLNPISGGNLVVDNQVDIIQYGHTLEQRYDLAVGNPVASQDVIYFNPLDYSIDQGFRLRAGATLVIGYGSGPGERFEFGLEEGMVVDTGFLKLFVLSKDLDLKWVDQESISKITKGDMDVKEMKDAIVPDVEVEWNALECVSVTVRMATEGGNRPKRRLISIRVIFGTYQLKNSRPSGGFKLFGCWEPSASGSIPSPNSPQV
ncbi:hypothetical protein DFH09DRAFT_1071129 [Mycena vulgaris]|nr:hypothetical protein DFH09DRAFT_1071129 [Mycena vulgaris]